MFIVIEGSGTLRVAGEMLPLRTGDVVFIPPGPEYPHQIINTSQAPLKNLSISTHESPEIVEYPDSGKYLAEAFSAAGSGSSSGSSSSLSSGAGAVAGPVRTFNTVQHRRDSVDYWDGEP